MRVTAVPPLGNDEIDWTDGLEYDASDPAAGSGLKDEDDDRVHQVVRR